MDTEDIDLMSEAGKLFIEFILIGVFLFVFTFLKKYFFAIIGQRLVERVRGKVFEKLLYLPLSWHDKKSNNVGRLCTLLSSDIEEIQNLTSNHTSSIL